MPREELSHRPIEAGGGPMTEGTGSPGSCEEQARDGRRSDTRSTAARQVRGEVPHLVNLQQVTEVGPGPPHGHEAYDLPGGPPPAASCYRGSGGHLQPEGTTVPVEADLSEER